MNLLIVDDEYLVVEEVVRAGINKGMKVYGVYRGYNGRVWYLWWCSGRWN